MHTNTMTLAHQGTPTARRVLGWWTEGLRFWRRAPVRLSLLGLGVSVGEMVFQVGVPNVGMLLSKIVATMLVAGIMLGLSQLDAEGRLPWGSLFAAFRRPYLLPALGAGLVGLVVFATQVGVACAIYGPAVFDAIALGHVLAHKTLLQTPHFMLMLVLPGLVPSTLLMFVLPRVVLGGAKLPAAIVDSLRVALVAPGAMLVTLLSFAAVMGLLGSVLHGALLVLLAPLCCAVSYAAYRDIFGYR